MTTRVEKARLVELDASFEEISGGRSAEVQFNPDTLKVSYANQIQTPQGASDQGGGAAQQFVGAGSTKLAVQLWFDVASNEDAPVEDVRELTRTVAQFIIPQEVQGQQGKFRPPVVRFIWGSFQFDGIMEGLEENLELFSEEGRPLRASLGVTISQQKMQFTIRPIPPADPAAAAAAPGTRPLSTPAPGQSVQQTASAQGNGAGWQQAAERNNIDNPRFPPPGRPLDLNRS